MTKKAKTADPSLAEESPVADSIPVPQPPLTPEQISVGKDVEIRRLTARVHELEQLYATVRDEREQHYNALVKAGSDYDALTQAHQQLVKDRDMQASTIRSMRATIDGLNVLVDSLTSGNERREAQIQQAVEALAELAARHRQFSLTCQCKACTVVKQQETALATHKEKG